MSLSLHGGRNLEMGGRNSYRQARSWASGASGCWMPFRLSLARHKKAGQLSGGQRNVLGVRAALMQSRNCYWLMNQPPDSPQQTQDASGMSSH